MALVDFIRNPEVIGPDSCPILHRWTIGGDRLARRLPVKLLVHHFMPYADDRDVHDHPRPFITLVLRGGYDDMDACYCMTPGVVRGGGPWLNCWRCHGSGVVLRERMTAGVLRRRRAGHKHRTQVYAEGCWTLVLMGPVRREWGFWREGRWMAWREYAARFGDGMRCP